MCGIIGYSGSGQAAPILLRALKQLEYRGYDSAGMAVAGEKVEVLKDVGKIAEIEERHNFLSLRGSVGIGHTRWATHGVPSQDNAHPHGDCKNEIFLIHNGVIENYLELKNELLARGHKFRSETDSEVIAHLLEEGKGDFAETFRKTVKSLSGSFAILAIREGDRNVYCARNFMPLVLGLGKGENFCASDVPAMLDHTKSVIYLGDGEMAVVAAHGVKVSKIADGKEVQHKPHAIQWTAESAKKGGFEHFMLKEISEQDSTIRQALGCDVRQGAELLGKYDDIQVVACGTSYHAGMVFKSLVQKYCRKRCEVAIGSEYGYSMLASKKTLIVAISQSGETADTLSAVRAAKKAGAKVLAVTNVVGSSLTREADASVYIGSGPEISVVATKTFTSQLVVLYKLAFTAAGMRKEIEQMKELSQTAYDLVGRRSEVEILASKLMKEKDFFFIGRGLSFPIAMEGALKLKEITYLHAEAYAAGELKHGPLSLLEDGIPVVAIAPKGEAGAKMHGNVKECRARRAKIIAISNDPSILAESEMEFRMPDVDELLAPIVYIIPLQMLAYYMAVKAGKDPDKPRNLAKSVTVE
jgi:glucosamine--fructose-6-phosphate aminotransferase (isomerizing)